MDPIWPQLLLQIVLIAVNAVFAASEIAVISLNENKLRMQAEEGDKKAAVMLKMMREPSDFLSTIQIAITLAGFLGSAFAADNFSDPIVQWLIDKGFTLIPRATLNTIAVIVITIILSYFTLVLGELVPKRVAMKKPDAVGRAVCGMINGMALVMKPVIWLLSKSTNLMLRLLHINPEEQEAEVTEEEIRMMVDLGGERGTIEAGEKQMIDNIFEFNNITAEECMTHRTDVTAISVEDTPEEIIALIRESGYSRFPVYEDDLDDIVGVLNTRDYLLNMRAESPKPLRDMLRPARFVPESVRADVLFRDMQREKAHLAIVVDEYGGTSGVITMEDLLEEIVGNIYDEYDEAEQPEIAAISEDEWRVSGGVEIKTLNEALDLDLPTDEEFDTLGGLVFAQLTTIPEDGSQPEVHCFGLTIRVTEITDRRVEWAIVKKDPPPEPEEGEGEKKDKDKDSDKDK